MNLVDSCGWLEYFADGPKADFYAPALEDQRIISSRAGNGRHMTFWEQSPGR